MVSLVPRQYFIGFLPLAAGAELITVFGVVNKASGIYGLLSIFTGKSISAAQWVLNIFSIILLPFFLYALHSVRRQNALPVVAYSYVFFLDMLSNIAFTIYFSVVWFREFDKADAEVDPSHQIDVPAERGVSITIIVLVLLCKMYFCIAIFGFARSLVRKAGLRADNGEGRLRALQYVLLGVIMPRFWSPARRGVGNGSSKGLMVDALEEGIEMY
ncbi:Inositolphosphorylceramide synthase subunit Kei1-domain-containing protein [Limtongia smithiae]|uniref:Inositolphosphorylceramide synthase subunit Kei1-domain-containing protein n=1 Tax=Limtongia smithiae TaxID=1125753 RepID=UPI0034CE63ED